MKKKLTKKQKLVRRRIAISLISLALALLLAGVVALTSAAIKIFSIDTSSQSPVSSENTSSSEPIISKVSSATILSTGDIMVHSTQLDGARVQGGDGYDFSAFFKEAESYFKAADLSVANLEITFGGSEFGAYSGYPVFNTPDSLADVIKNSGLGMVLTANNHCYDTGFSGLKRTQQVLKDKGISYIGTRLSEQDATFSVREVNGIKIGMAAFTYETGRTDSGIISINGITVKAEATNLVNSFNYNHLDEFYAEVEQILEKMEQAGAEATVFYIHWGNEYQTTPNTMQKTIAQELCNRGIDVIVGSHPHVIQPVEMLYAESGEHKTVCLYSTGNAISNQRQELMDSCPSGHTEDGLFFYCTFDKYSDGEVVLSGVDVLPTWVDKYRGGSQYQYTIYPLNSENDGTDKYGLSSAAADKARKSYNRTKELIAEPLCEIQKILGCEVTFKE